MKNKKQTKSVTPIEGEVAKDKISRKEALKKTGYYAVTTTLMIQLLGSPQKSLAASPAPPPPW